MSEQYDKDIIKTLRETNKDILNGITKLMIYLYEHMDGDSLIEENERLGRITIKLNEKMEKGEEITIKDIVQPIQQQQIIGNFP